MLMMPVKRRLEEEPASCNDKHGSPRFKAEMLHFFPALVTVTGQSRCCCQSCHESSRAGMPQRPIQSHPLQKPPLRSFLFFFFCISEVSFIFT